MQAAADARQDVTQKREGFGTIAGDSAKRYPFLRGGDRLAAVMLANFQFIIFRRETVILIAVGQLAMLTLAMITEMVFSWPGLGRWLINAIRQQDYAAISAGVMVIGALVIIVNVISDILGAMANPLKHKEWYALR